MKKWNKVHIKDFGEIMTGRTPSTHIDQFWGKDYLFITPTELHQSYHINYSEKKISETGMREIGLKKIGNISILVGCIGWDMGNVGVVNKKCAFNQQINAITNFSESYNPYYIYYLLSGKKELFRRIAGVTRTPILKKSDFENIELIVPDRTMQDRIATLLKQFDDKIALNNRVNATLEAMAKTLYDYWFVQFDFPDEKGRPYKTSGGTMVYNEELGREIPAGWEVKRVKDLLDVVTGKEDANFSVPNGAYKFFTCSNEVLRCDTPAFEGSAVLLAGNGDFNVKHFTGEFNAYQRTYVLIPNDIKYYAVLYISVQNMVQSLINHSNGSIVKFITKSDVENIPVLDSPCRKLYDYLNKIYNSIEANIEENHRLAALRDWLLPMLMNGQVGFKGDC